MMNNKRCSALPFEKRQTGKDRLRKAREDAGIRVEELAANLGVSANSIRLWERTHRLPKNPRILTDYLRAIGLEPAS